MVSIRERRESGGTELSVFVLMETEEQVDRGRGASDFLLERKRESLGSFHILKRDSSFLGLHVKLVDEDLHNDLVLEEEFLDSWKEGGRKAVIG